MANPNQKGVSDFRPPQHRNPGARPAEPYIDPGAAPAVASYLANQQQRALARHAGLPKYDTPVGGGPAPTFPRLDAAHAEGQTMAEQAATVNSPPLQHQMANAHAKLGPNSIVEPPLLSPQSMARAAVAPTAQGKSLGLLPTDMLPPEAQNDPAFQRGNGSAFAVSQPALAARYGVIRNGQKIAPQQLAAGPGASKGQLRPETLKGLSELEELRRRQSPEAMAAAEAKAEEQLEGTAASFSASAGEPPKKKEPLTEEDAQRRLELLDSFDYDSLRQAVMKDVLNNPGQREIIEARLTPLDIGDLILKNSVSQRVPIVPGKFEVTYTSMSGDDDLALKRLLMMESRSVEVTERYLFDKYAFMSLTVGITAVNGNMLPSHRKDSGEFDEGLFMKKFEWIMKRPLHMLSSIGVNHTWFEGRVRRLFVAEKVGNT